MFCPRIFILATPTHQHGDRLGQPAKDPQVNGCVHTQIIIGSIVSYVHTSYSEIMADVEASASIVVSPVPGINIELATLLITAIKTRRKFLSKSSSGENQERLQALKENAEDTTMSFIIQLRKYVEASSKSSKKSTKKNDLQQYTSNAALHSAKFLLSTLSEVENSFHLRRAALAILKEILERSSDARAYLDSGGVLMDFVSAIQRLNDDNQGEVGIDATSMSPKMMFQQDAIELTSYLSDKFGSIYPKFTVASRLMGEIPVAIFAPASNDEHRYGNEMKILLIERDTALRKGTKTCDVLERIIGRVDECFRQLAPRYGGFMCHDGSNIVHQLNAEIEPVYIDLSDEVAGTADGSIAWEEGDSEYLDDDPTLDDNINCDLDKGSSRIGPQTEHSSQVEHTLDVLQRSGLLQEGGLSVQLGAPLHNATLASDANGEAQVKMTKLIYDLLSRRLPLLNRWVYALSNADGMKERAIKDPVSLITGTDPASLVLLSKDERALRVHLLKRMMKIKAEIGAVIESAKILGGLDEEMHANINHKGATALSPSDSKTIQNERKRTRLPAVAMKPATKKKPKHSKFKVIYRKK